jgi:hypothetical protein
MGEFPAAVSELPASTHVCFRTAPTQPLRERFDGFIAIGAAVEFYIDTARI